MTIQQALAGKRKGYYIGQRLILPFQCQILKVIFDNQIYTEVVENKDLLVHQDPNNTSIFITESGRLANYVNNYEYIKIIACEMDADLTDRKMHRKIVCEIKDNHEVAVAEANDDVLFIE